MSLAPTKAPAECRESAEQKYRDRLVTQLVAAQSAIAPSSIAVAAGHETLTYGELNTCATQISHILHSHGIGPDTLVGVCMERSAAMVVANLGVLRSGGAYVPLDPDYPKDRLAFMLNDARPPVLLTQRHIVERLPRGKWRTITLDVDELKTSSHSGDLNDDDMAGENLAYVIYTSGSTGWPKGVQITHNNLSNLVFWHRQAFSVQPTDRATQLASPGFDAAVWEVWPYLTAGASVHIVDDAARSDPAALRNWLVKQRITIAFVPTPLAERIITLQWPGDTALKTLLTGADTLHRYPLRGLPFTLINNYGPTECTVVASSGPVPFNEHLDDLPPIGRPISNTEIYILNEEMQQVPFGVTGQIYIGGAGVARGYLNRSELTRERFVPNPFSCDPKAPLYKTGDLGRYLPDSQIAFMGRIDDQIKIRGYRIEPDEIVKALSEHPAVLASAVAALEDCAQDKYLVGYLVFGSESRPTPAELLEFLRQRLPAYMVPSTFVQLESLPLTSNGKVDRGALPVPTSSNILRDEPFVRVPTPVENRVAGILAELLKLDQVGLDDDFFLLGGHSLLATQVITQIDNAFGIELTLRDVFQAPTVAGLSDKIERLLPAEPKQ